MAKPDAQKFKLSKGPSKLVKAAKTALYYIGPGAKKKTAGKVGAFVASKLTKIKKRNTTPKREYNKEQNPRQVAKEFKKITGESIKKLNDKPLYQTTGAKQFKLDYKKKDNVYRGMTPGQAVLVKNNSSHFATTKNILKKITVKKIK